MITIISSGNVKPCRKACVGRWGITGVYTGSWTKRATVTVLAYPIPAFWKRRSNERRSSLLLPLLMTKERQRPARVHPFLLYRRNTERTKRRRRNNFGGSEASRFPNLPIGNGSNTARKHHGPERFLSERTVLRYPEPLMTVPRFRGNRACIPHNLEELTRIIRANIPSRIVSQAWLS